MPPEITSFLSPGLALLFILRRGLKPTRIKPNRLWVYPVVITVLAVLSLGHAKAPGIGAIAVYAATVAVGVALGWLTTQHIELTLDEATGTILSKPTVFGTATTVAVFGARAVLDFFMKAPKGQGALTMFAVQHGASLAVITNAGLLFIAARGLGRAAHMWLRIQPLLAQHKASQAPQ